MNCCNWCGGLKKDNEKYYCTSCKEYCKRECKTCHKPYPNLNKFSLSQIRCDSCSNRYENVKKKKKLKEHCE